MVKTLGKDDVHKYDAYNGHRYWEICLPSSTLREEGGTGPPGAEGVMVTMNAFERFADARHCTEGKAVAVVLSVLLALSFLNLSVWADRALAEESGAPDATALTVSDKPVDDGAPVPADDDPADDAEEPTGNPAPTPESAGEAAPLPDEGDEPAEPSVPGRPVPEPDFAPSVPVVDEPATPVLPLAAVQGTANDGTRFSATTSDPAGFPAGAALRVETALSDEVARAVQAALAPGERIGNHAAYTIEVVDEAGNVLPATGTLTVTAENPSIAPLGVTVFRIVGYGNAQRVEETLDLVPDMTTLSFNTTVASSVYSFVTVEEEPVAIEPVVPKVDEEGEGETPVEPALPADPTPAPDLADPVVTESLVLYAGESRTITCVSGHTHLWVTDDAAVAALENTSSATVTICAQAPGTTTVRCDDRTAYDVTVKPRPASEEVTHFYFLPATDDGSASTVANAKYLGSGLVKVPAGYDSYTSLVNGSILPTSTDAEGKPVVDKVVNLSDLIIEAPSDREIRAGLAAYYKGTIDGAQTGETSRLKYDSSWTYTWEPVLFEGPKHSEGYNGAAISPDSAYHMYVSLKVATPHGYTVAYTVQTPTGIETRTVMHDEADAPIALNGFAEGASSVTADGVAYPAVKVSDAGVRYRFDGWYADAAFRTAAPAQYAAGASATFYARYIAEDAPTVTFDVAGGTFADGATASKTLAVNPGGSYWLPEEPERFGYDFAGWKNEATGIAAPAGVGRKMGDTDVRYVATWTAAAATISFDAGEGSLPEGVAATLEGSTGEALPSRALPAPVLPGYRFIGWYANPGLTGAAVNELPSAFPAGNTVYYAKYEVDPAQRYTVTYRTDLGGRLSDGLVTYPSSVPFSDEGLLVGGIAGVRGATALTNPGYRFLGWFKELDDGVQVQPVTEATEPVLRPDVLQPYLNGNAEEGYEDTTFVAKFTFVGPGLGEPRSYAIEYYLMGDDGTYPSWPACSVTRLSYQYQWALVSDADKALDLTPFGVPAGYAPEDYVVDEDAPGALYQMVLEPGVDVTLKVYLQKRLAVSFAAGAHGSFQEGALADDAVLSDDGQTATYRRLLGEASPAVPAVDAHEGYRFNGWAENGVLVADPAAAPVSRAAAFEAQYTALPASIQFETNGGTAAAPIEGVTDQSLADVGLPVTEREGYAFVGWYDHSDLSGEAIQTLPATMPAGTTTYYARWTADPAKIIFDRNADDAEGTTPTGLQGATDDAVTAAFPETVNLTRPGYRFAGWNTAADGSGETVTAFPGTFPRGTTVYYAQWRLDTSELSAEDFSYEGVYDGRAHRIALPAGIVLKEGEKLAQWVDGAWVTDPRQFPAYTDVADSAEGIRIGILDRDGFVIFGLSTVSVSIAKAPLSVVTGSLIHPFDGTDAVCDQIAVTGLLPGETVGARTTGRAREVGEEVPNTFELTWAAAGNGYTAKEGNYEVTSDLGTVRVVTAECPVTMEGYVGVYDGEEHGIRWEASEAEITFDADTAYTEAGRHEVGYTAACPDHGTFSGTIDVVILPRPVTIAVQDSFKIAATADPVFHGAIVEGELVREDDLGVITFGRDFEGEDVGVYQNALTALFKPNANYAVDVLRGTFTIGPAGSTVVPPQNPLLPPRDRTPGPSGPGTAVPGEVEGPAGADGSTLAAIVYRALAGTDGAAAGNVTATEGAPASAAGLQAILDEEVPMAAAPSFDEGVPTVTRVGAEVIEDDATALGAFDEPHCWMHWLVALGIILTIGYALAVVARRLGYARKISDFDDSLTGGIVTEEAPAARGAVHHRA